MSCKKFLISIVVLIYFIVNQNTDPSDFDDFITRSKSLGYGVEEHFVETEDGYVLSIHRLRGKVAQKQQIEKFQRRSKCTEDKCQEQKEFRRSDSFFIPTSTKEQELINAISNKKYPILMGHGLGGSSDTFIRNEETMSLAYVLSNQGFDVFLMNSRGNLYSSRHMKFSKTQREYWDFSFDEMAKYDLPAVTEYIVEGIYNNYETKLNYIGHSQGCNVVLASLSEEYTPEHYFESLFLITPAAIQKNSNSTISNMMKKNDFLPFLRSLGMNEFLRMNTLNYYVCKAFPKICESTIQMVTDTEKSPINYDMFYRLMYHYPAGTSTKCYIHFNQMIRSERFQHFDYGEELNLIYYSQIAPPEYNLANIKNKIHVIAGTQDLASNLNDVNQLITELKNAKNVTISVFEEGHCSFILGTDNSYQQKIIQLLNEQLEEQ